MLLSYTMIWRRWSRCRMRVGLAWTRDFLFAEGWKTCPARGD